MHDHMPYDPIQGQGHGGVKVVKMAKVYLLCQYARNQKTNGKLGYSRQYQNFIQRDF